MSDETAIKIGAIILAIIFILVFFVPLWLSDLRENEE
jgi:hypothetical protein